jgi:hypothetical protein
MPLTPGSDNTQLLDDNSLVGWRKWGYASI